MKEWLDKLPKKDMKNNALFGVVSGFSTQMGLSPVPLRFLLIIITLMTGIWPTLIIYLLLAWLMKE